MLVRALKMLSYFRNESRRHNSSPRQPLISRAAKSGLMAEKAGIGNGERGLLAAPAASSWGARHFYGEPRRMAAALRGRCFATAPQGDGFGF